MSNTRREQIEHAFVFLPRMWYVDTGLFRLGSYSTNEGASYGSSNAEFGMVVRGGKSP